MDFQQSIQDLGVRDFGSFRFEKRDVEFPVRRDSQLLDEVLSPFQFDVDCIIPFLEDAFHCEITIVVHLIA
jgi:hypothetical protein